ncbi:lipoprotein-releasing system transmembrane protein LolE [bacterium BMS3Abin05]|nr:lipoprotein-releasing system transmembrane protein LolE [bacterium BMS3Abin05]GBE27378.1 lipoprotein-releasing system transmembrane protein LolE [bacterium BMS3Bbin03]HDZ10727.1 lipoprotein-releasing ABC transporter permease subunit [Bacteroidota bacterium]
MSYEFFIARRYLKAKRKTGFISLITYFSIGGVTIGVAALIIVLSVMNGFEKEVRSRIIGFDAHIRVRTFHNQGIQDWQEILNKVLKLKHVTGASPYILGKALIKSGKNVEGLFLKGTDEKRIQTVSDLGKNIIYGTLNLGMVQGPEDTKPLPGIVLGRSIDDRLEALVVGDKITAISPSMTTSVFSPPSVKQFRLAGIFESGMFEYDDSYGYVSIKSAQQLFQMKNRVSGIEIKLDDMYQANNVAKKIDKMLGYPYYTLTWFDMHKTLFSWMEIEKWAMFIVLSLIIMVAAFNIISSLIMIVMEKTREIGILKSMGATSSSIMRIFIYEGLVVGIIGTILGSIIGYVLCWSQQTYRFFSLPADIYFINTLPIYMKTTDFMMIGAAAILLSFFATLYPSKKASKLDPVQAIRYE